MFRLGLFLLCLSTNIFGQVILITGASKGIGKKTAQLFHEKGHKVYAGVRSEFNEAPYSQIFLDVTDQQSINQAVESLVKQEGKIDVLINNAGIGIYGPIESLSIAQLKDVFDVNFFGSIRVMQTVIPNMRAQNQGIILNISSIAAQSSLPGFDSYNSSKAALESVSESMIGPLSLSNIRIHVIEPGPVNTGFLDRISVGEESENFLNFNHKSIAFFKNRVGSGQSPSDVAEVIYETASNAQSGFRVPTTPEAGKRIETARNDSDVVSNRKQSFIGLWNMSTK